MKKMYMFVLAGLVLASIGCSSIPSKKISGMSLGMNPIEVEQVMGKPDTIRASKVYNDGQTDTVWEYSPAWFEFNPKSYWVTFQNDRVVQWGEPGDWAGKSGKSVPVEDYSPAKSGR